MQTLLALVALAPGLVARAAPPSIMLVDPAGLLTSAGNAETVSATELGAWVAAAAGGAGATAHQGCRHRQ